MPPKSRPKPPQRFVYVIGPAAGLQKVGLATDPRQRLAALQTASPFDLVIHVAVAVPFGEARAVEARAHKALAEAIAAVPIAAGAAETATESSSPPLFATDRRAGGAGGGGGGCSAGGLGCFGVVLSQCGGATTGAEEVNY